MSLKIMYFSRTGVSKRIAEKLSKKLDVELIEIKDDKNWHGFIGFIRGGYYSSKWKKTIINLIPETILNNNDEIILISPLWSSNIAPAAFSLLLDNKIMAKNTTLVLTNAGTSPKHTYRNVEEKLGKFKNKYTITKMKKNEDSVINEIVDNMKDEK
jgi:hypothetical protein